LPIAGQKKNRPSEGVKILAVEDDAVSRAVSRAVLRKSRRKIGHDVIEAEDGREAWTIMESYLNERTGSEFSHSVGPDCIVLVVQPQLEKLKAERVIKKL
jgi:CheY-like chemotaxis protein